MDSLENILKGKEAPVVEQPKEEAPREPAAETQAETPEQKAQRERDEKGRFKAKQEGETPAKPEAPKAEPPKVETKPAPTAEQKKAESPVEKPSQQVPLTALQEERRKRQALEQQLASLQQPKKAPDVLQDPQGFQEHLNSTLQSREIDMRVNMSAAWAKEQFPDYADVMAKWEEALSENPALYHQAVAQDLPAVWAYKHIKRQIALQEIGDPGEYRSKLEKELREKLEAEFAQKQAPQRPAAPVPPPSLANATSASAGTTSAPQWGGPTPMTQLLRR